ncbi:hypothetical protein L6R52_23245 [Myxococcota bacterium]|nr:hypothetical protein [Myxococcota bacterium]
MIRELATATDLGPAGIVSLFIAISLFSLVVARLVTTKKEDADSWSRLPLDDER